MGSKTAFFSIICLPSRFFRFFSAILPSFMRFSVFFAFSPEKHSFSLFARDFFQLCKNYLIQPLKTYYIGVEGPFVKMSLFGVIPGFRLFCCIRRGYDVVSQVVL